jgi:MoxR-like ATPase
MSTSKKISGRQVTLGCGAKNRATLTATAKITNKMDTNKVWSLITVALRHCNRILVWGLPGTGKSFLAQREALASREVFNITLTEDTSSVELRGHYIPRGSELVWQDGAAISAWRTGGRLIVNELDKASADVQSFLLGLMDNRESASITLPTGETVTPQEGFQFVATSNSSPDELPEALRSRLPVTIQVTEPNPEAINLLPENLRKIAAQTATVEQEERRISLRAWYEYARLVTEGHTTTEDAAFLVFGERAPDILSNITMAEAQA